MWSVQGDTKVCTHVVYVFANSSITLPCQNRGHSDAVLCLQFVGDTLVSGSSDQTIKVSINFRRSLYLVILGVESPTRSVQDDSSRPPSSSHQRAV